MLTSINLKIKDPRKRVVAKELAGDNEVPDSDGSVEGDAGDQIQWKNISDRTLVLEFFRKGESDWPFAGTAKPNIELSPGQTDERRRLRRHTSAVLGWKYKVTVHPHDPDIEPLDPMIIIRGGSFLNLALAAGTGLVVGALATLVLVRLGVF